VQAVRPHNQGQRWGEQQPGNGHRKLHRDGFRDQPDGGSAGDLPDGIPWLDMEMMVARTLDSRRWLIYRPQHKWMRNLFTKLSKIRKQASALKHPPTFGNRRLRSD
jgi:hypothetical protein